MKHSHHIILILLAIFATAAASAQQSSSRSSEVRRGNRESAAKTQDKGANVTERMQQFFDEPERSNADAQWMKVVYRQLDLEKVKNAPLYYPEELSEGQENLFRIIMRLLASGELSAYEYLDGREVFTDQYKVNVRDMLDRFHILYADAKGSTEKNPRFAIEESDVPCNEVLSYYILEKWELDKRSNRMRTTVEAICPVLHRAGDFGGEAVKYPHVLGKNEFIAPSSHSAVDIH